MAAGTRMAAGPVSGPSGPSGPFGPSGLLPGLSSVCPRSVLGLLFNLLSDLLPDLLFNRLSGRQSRLPE